MELSWLLLASIAALALAEPLVVTPGSNVTYQGFVRSDVEVFLGIPYAEDTGGENRFKPPQIHVPENGSTVDATSYGPACPQVQGRPPLFPLYLSNVTDISEDCLHLNIARPNGTDELSKHPVMVWIHGGSFWTGSNADIVSAPDALVLQSVENKLPVIHVSINYRLGAFGFAQSKALYDEQSLNAGLRDQRLATEWVRDNIEAFGGDPEAITIFGQSSGGLAVGMQIVAYGGTKPVPFQQAICESQVLEPGITGNFTYHQMDLLASALDCTSSALDSNETLACLRNVDTATFLNASISTYSGDVSNNIGDCWLPVVDDDFLPAPPSELVSSHRMAANLSVMIGWCDDDLGFFTNRSITTNEDTRNFIQSYLPDMKSSSVTDLLALYPVSDFTTNTTANLTAEFYRSSRLFRDILMTCMPIWAGQNFAQLNSNVYLYDQNASILPPILAQEGYTGLGPVHTSEFAYVFANFSHYNSSDLPGFAPTPEDYALLPRQTRSWSSFAAVGQPSLDGKQTLQGWERAFVDNETRIYVIGGGEEGLSAVEGEGVSNGVLAMQMLAERCGFLNSEEIIPQLKF